MLDLRGIRPLLLIALSAGGLLAAGCGSPGTDVTPSPSDAEVSPHVEPVCPGRITRGILPI